MALLLLGCTPAPTEPAPRVMPPLRSVELRTSDRPAPRGASLLQRAMLSAHAAARAEVGLPPLAWDDTLADHALAYACTLAAEHRFEHAHQPMGPSREGENLWTGTRDAYRYDEMVGSFVAEKRMFVNRPTPYFSTSGQWQDVAHYTQIVWRGTTRVGCALASNDRDDTLVCRYSPAGNVVGQAAF
ncbi:CAP domain-containing protein [Sphingomonas immobilis]|uniref:CAP domain-containing protein n=1 Tax=Sphingomonas immobilis TaxID=3063997 RepID=UPI00272C1404|nr:CAP domain-containing protein [Sphingomonas sp. CA1-15]